MHIAHVCRRHAQSYSHCAISEIPVLVHQLSSCIDDLAKSYAMLPTASTQPGENRVHLVRFTRQLNLTRIPQQRFRSIQVCGSVIECEVVVRDLGVYLDNELSMKHHANKIASACLYHSRRLRQILSHRAPTRVVPFIRNWTYAGQQRSLETAGDITRLIPLGLLQRHPRWPPGVDTIATECRRPSRARS